MTEEKANVHKFKIKCIFSHKSKWQTDNKLHILQTDYKLSNQHNRKKISTHGFLGIYPQWIHVLKYIHAPFTWCISGAHTIWPRSIMINYLCVKSTHIRRQCWLFWYLNKCNFKLKDDWRLIKTKLKYFILNSLCYRKENQVTKPSFSGNGVGTFM